MQPTNSYGGDADSLCLRIEFCVTPSVEAPHDGQRAAIVRAAAMAVMWTLVGQIEPALMRCQELKVDRVDALTTDEYSATRTHRIGSADTGATTVMVTLTPKGPGVPVGVLAAAAEYVFKEIQPHLLTDDQRDDEAKFYAALRSSRGLLWGHQPSGPEHGQYL